MNQVPEHANSDAADDFQGEPNSRSVYMITYSRADLLKVPTKEIFAQFVKEAFLKKGTAKILQYVVCKEAHQDGDWINREGGKQ